MSPTFPDTRLTPLAGVCGSAPREDLARKMIRQGRKPIMEKKETKTEIPALWTMRDVAAYAQCGRRTVRNLVKAGMPHIRLGRLVRFDARAVLEWMNDRWR